MNPIDRAELIDRLFQIQTECSDENTQNALEELMATLLEGTEVITVGRSGSSCANFKSGGKSFSMPIWTMKKYIAKKNYKGQLKWFLKSHIGRTIASKSPSDKLIKEAEEYSKNNNLIFVEHVNQYNSADYSQLL